MSRSQITRQILVAARADSVRPDPTVESLNLIKVEAQKKALKISEKEWELYEQGFSDLCTIQVSNKDFKIGMNKLMAASLVFEKMFQSGMQEAQTGILNLKDTSSEAIHAFIKYLHLHTFEGSNEIAPELYLLADKYEIIDLKEKCTQFFINELSQGNVLDRLVLSFKYHDKGLKRGIIRYLSQRPPKESFKTLIRSTEWAKLVLENKQLSDEIIDEIFETLNWHNDLWAVGLL